jgi:hypothetical protein
MLKDLLCQRKSVWTLNSTAADPADMPKFQRPGDPRIGLGRSLPDQRSQRQFALVPLGQ